MYEGRRLTTLHKNCPLHAAKTLHRRKDVKYKCTNFAVYPLAVTWFLFSENDRKEAKVLFQRFSDKDEGGGGGLTMMAYSCIRKVDGQ